jgi:nucleoside-diphosphate-sugar epimerase
MPEQLKAIVTGAAGFIGSSIAQRLLDDGLKVIGVDCLTDYYDTRIKESNLAPLLANERFILHRKPILDLNWPSLMEGVGTVYHQAAQAGVRASWGESFECYTTWNVLSTQRILEGMKGTGARMVYASSSSVYGETDRLPMREDHYLQPMSPYGVTKLAAEHLCVLYWRNFQVPTVSLRYFTVYGPKQRPDMAFHKFIKAALAGEPITLYGDGAQTRDFTFIGDAVEANLLAAAKGTPGGVYNIGGGSRISVNGVLEELGKILDREIAVERIGKQKGDVTHTYADTERARTDLGFVPKTPLAEGLRRECEWFEAHRALLAGS